MIGLMALVPIIKWILPLGEYNVNGDFEHPSGANGGSRTRGPNLAQAGFDFMIRGGGATKRPLLPSYNFDVIYTNSN